MAVEGRERMESDLEKVIERGGDGNTPDAKISISPTTEEAGGATDLRTRLDGLIHSHRFMVGIVVLVILDCLMVIAVLLFDLEIVKLGDDHHFVAHIFHYCSLAILSLFLIEVSMRIYVLRLRFFKHKLEVLDAIVVVVSWILDIVFRDNDDATTGVGLLILLRLWRITRIINGIVLSVQKQADQKVEKERHLREASEAEVEKYAAYCSAVETRMEGLENLLLKHDIDFSSVQKILVEKPTANSATGTSKEQDRGKEKGGKEMIDEAVVELNEIVGKVNEMEMKRRNSEMDDNGEVKNIVI
ncbi:hypothetical protein PoB_007298000 [Plakobranchus ocellatus]|uniref:Voltage-gated hydrogen channel 1 n=1 Tax=Plakobranchus ocellatus TaxID=259542 RepID=A0AAV4DRB0_9GAST|nr:hypothetical protein PoB_007298000 [Plakobranchus ocellatus]